MQAYCPKIPHPELARSCASREKEYSNSLADHEEYIRTGAFNDPPPAKKVYRDTTPVLRCIPNLPKIRESSAEYKLSDPSGRYRHEHLTKTKFGFAINLKLSEITNQKLNNWKRFLKMFSDPRNGKTYTFEIAPQHSCGPGNNPDLNCSVSAISIRMVHNEGSVQKGQARAAFPIKLDTHFDLTLPIDEDEIEEFSLSCVIASKIRKGGWIFSDEFFE